MTVLLQLCPDDRYVMWVISVLLQATAVLAIGWLIASLWVGETPRHVT